jgi:hypothetical protein
MLCLGDKKSSALLTLDPRLGKGIKSQIPNSKEISNSNVQGSKGEHLSLEV